MYIHLSNQIHSYDVIGTNPYLGKGFVPSSPALNLIGQSHTLVKFIYSEKVIKFYKISTLLLTVCTAVKSKVEILQNFVAFSEYMNFNQKVFEPIVSAHSSDAM